MHAVPARTTRAIFCFWITLLAMATIAVSSPVAEPEPAPIDPNLASVLGSNLNLGCQNGCAAAASAQQLDENAALGAAVSPLTILGSFVVASGVLASI